MKYVVTMLLLAGAAYGQEQYEIGAGGGYGFYRDGSIFSVGGGVKFRLIPNMLPRVEFRDYLTRLSRHRSK